MNPDDKPTYMSLARLLKTAFSQLDASFERNGLNATGKVNSAGKVSAY